MITRLFVSNFGNQIINYSYLNFYSPEVNLHMYHFSCPFQCYVQCSLILSSRYSIWFFANHHWNLAYSGNSEVLHTTITTMYVRIPVFWNVTLVSLDNWFLMFWKDRSPSSPKLQGPWTLNPRGQTFVKMSEITYPVM